MWSGQYLWGYLMTAIAVFLMPLVLLAYERGRLGWAASGAFLVSWLQPWQGATLAFIVIAVGGWRLARGPERPSSRATLVFLAAVAVPAVYYFALSRLDPAWELAGRSNAAGAMPEWSWPWWAVVLTLAPLAAPAALAYRLPAPTWQEQGRARVAVRGPRGLPAPDRHVPVPRVPGAGAAPVDSRRAGRLHGLEAAVHRRGGEPAGVHEPSRPRAQARGVP
jgi:hypothetical protein